MVDGYLTTGDVARILGVKVSTVHTYRMQSRAGSRYGDHPFPEPDSRVGNMPLWRADREGAIREWATGRAGQGVGGGPKPRQVDSTLDKDSPRA